MANGCGCLLSFHRVIDLLEILLLNIGTAFRNSSRHEWNFSLGFKLYIYILYGEHMDAYAIFLIYLDICTLF